MSVIDDAARLRNAALLARLNDIAQSAIAGEWRHEAADLCATTPVPVAVCLLVGIVADQQKQIDELRAQLRKVK